MLPVLALLWVAGASPTATAILRQHECHRCHQVDGLKPPPMALSCVGCHADIAKAELDPARMERGAQRFGRANYQRFVDSTSGVLCHVPALADLKRFRASWLKTFLLAPYDLRPNLTESMIRHNLTPGEVDALVRAWKGEPDRLPTRQPSPERLAEGAALYEEKSCGVCHLFGNLPSKVAEEYQFELTPRIPQRALAPDLRHARVRMNRSTVAAYIRNPVALNRHAQMPRPELTSAETELLADFVYFGTPGPRATARVVRPPPFDASDPVPTFEEIDARVFKKVCRHCHSEPDLDGEGGPGNTGGMGFSPAGLSLADYDGLMEGSLGPAGERLSVFRPGPSGEPVLLERLRLRYVENERDFVRPGEDDLADRRRLGTRGERGMPLGLPALSPDDFALLERWVKGGRPAPKDAARAAQGTHAARQRPD